MPLGQVRTQLKDGPQLSWQDAFPPQVYQELRRFSETGDATDDMCKVTPVVTHVIDTFKQGPENLALPETFLDLVGVMNARSQKVLRDLQERADYTCQLPGELLGKARQLEEERLERERRTGRDGTGVRTAFPRCGN